MKTLGQMTAIFGMLAAGGFRAQMMPALKLIGDGVKREVENEIGEYQPSIGNFPATAQLAEATLERKARAGTGKAGNPDSPLWATGEYHDSIETQIHFAALAVEIGSNVEYAEHMEFGTETGVPPRPVFEPSALREVPKLLPAINAIAGSAIAVHGGTFGSSKGAVNIFP